MGRHTNKQLNADYRKYGEEAFEFLILMQTKDASEAARVERETILELKATSRCYNSHTPPLDDAPITRRMKRELEKLSKRKPKEGKKL